MHQKNLELLKTHIISNVAPILVEKVPKEVFGKNSVILDANIDKSYLNGHYEGINYLPPKWYENLEQNSILIIDNLSHIPKQEQKKFIEILKYRKISTFPLPEKCVVIITCDSLEKISEEIISLVACIGK